MSAGSRTSYRNIVKSNRLGKSCPFPAPKVYLTSVGKIKFRVSRPTPRFALRVLCRSNSRPPSLVALRPFRGCCKLNFMDSSLIYEQSGSMFAASPPRTCRRWMRAGGGQRTFLNSDVVNVLSGHPQWSPLLVLARKTYHGRFVFWYLPAVSVFTVRRTYTSRQKGGAFIQ